MGVAGWLNARGSLGFPKSCLKALVTTTQELLIAAAKLEAYRELLREVPFTARVRFNDCLPVTLPPPNGAQLQSDEASFSQGNNVMDKSMSDMIGGALEQAKDLGFPMAPPRPTSREVSSYRFQLYRPFGCRWRGTFRSCVLRSSPRFFLPFFFLSQGYVLFARPQRPQTAGEDRVRPQTALPANRINRVGFKSPLERPSTAKY